MEENGEKEGCGHDAAAEVGEERRSLREGLFAGVGQKIAPLETHDRLEVGQPGEGIGAVFAVKFVERQSERIPQHTPVVPSPRQEWNDIKRRRGQRDEPAGADGHHHEDPESGKDPHPEAVAQSDPTEQRGGQQDEEEGLEFAARGICLQRDGQREESSAEKEEHGHLRQAGKGEAPQEIGEEDKSDADQGERRVEEPAPEQVGQQERAGKKKKTRHSDRSLGGRDGCAGSEGKVHAGDAEDRRIDQRAEGCLAGFAQRQVDAAGAGKSEMHGQRSRVERAETLPAGHLPPDLRLIHRLGHGKSVEFESEPHHRDEGHQDHDDESADPDSRASLIERVQEVLDIDLDRHAVRNRRVPDVRGACGGVCGG